VKKFLELNLVSLRHLCTVLMALQTNVAQGFSLLGYVPVIYITKIGASWTGEGTVARSPFTPDKANIRHRLHSCTDLDSNSRSQRSSDRRHVESCLSDRHGSTIVIILNLTVEPIILCLMQLLLRMFCCYGTYAKKCKNLDSLLQAVIIILRGLIS
jgi:hypothetical protein